MFSIPPATALDRADKISWDADTIACPPEPQNTVHGQRRDRDR
jgi:hypothetical protein